MGYWSEQVRIVVVGQAEEDAACVAEDQVLDAGEVEQAVRQMAETGLPIPAAERSLLRKDGSRIAVFSSHALVQIPGRAPEVFCMDIDLTDRKQAEEILLARTDQLEAVGIVSREITRELQRFGRAGVPLVLVYPRDPQKPPLILPSLLTPGIVLDALDKAH